MKPEFVSTVERFLEFAKRNQLGTFQPNQWEVTYVNHIPQGTVWKSPADWGFFDLLRSIPTIDNLVQAESFAGEWHFVIPPQAGRLHIAWQHALKDASEQNGQEVIQLTLTARGPLPASKEPMQGVNEGLDLGHSTIVRTFANVMTSDANKFWG